MPVDVRQKPMIRAWAHAVLIVTAVAGALLLGELLLQLWWPQPLYKFDKGLFVADPVVGYRLGKNREALHTQPDYSYVIRTNSAGFRGEEPQWAADRLVLILGDSFAFGQGVPEGVTISDVTRKYFRSRGMSFDLPNSGVPGYAPINEQPVLKELLPRYRPHMVILFFYWNDIDATESLVVKDGYLVLSGASRFGPLREFLNNSSHVYALLKQVYYRWHEPVGVQGSMGRMMAPVARTVAALEEMKELCDRQGTPFVVMIVPPSTIRAFAQPWDEAKQELLGRLTAQDVAHYDLEQDLQPLQEDQRVQLSFRQDPHWRADGHQLFAKSLIHVIERRYNWTQHCADLAGVAGARSPLRKAA
jgi:hypothetical protein